jgi:two-component system, response regulator
MGSGKAILLVEDNPSDIELTRRALDKHNIMNRLVVAEDGQEALDYLFGAGSGPGAPEGEAMPAVILLDLKLPGIDGIEVLKRIKSNEATRRIPVIVLTTSKEEADVARSYDEGANSYVRKPVDFTQFSEAVRQLGLYWLLLNEQPPDIG